MKKLLLLFLFVLPLIVMGQNVDVQKKIELQLVEKLYFERGDHIATDKEHAKLNGLIDQMCADTTLKVHIIGYCDKWGGVEFNKRFSMYRALNVANWMKKHSVLNSQIAYVGEGIDSLASSDKEARRVEVLRELEMVKDAPKVDVVEQNIDKEEAECEVVEAKKEVAPKESSPTEAIAPEIITRRSNFALRTNLLYWLGGMMNLGTEFKKPESNFGFLVNGGYSPFGDTKWNKNFGGWFVAPEIRFYFPANEKWFIGAQYLTGGFNVKLSDIGKQGTVSAGGVMGGYKITLSDNFDMDFTLGAGYGTLKYDRYTHDNATNTNPYVEKAKVKSSVAPIQAGVNLIWKIK